MRVVLLGILISVCIWAQECVARSITVPPERLARQLGIGSLLTQNPQVPILQAHLRAGSCKFSKEQGRHIQDLRVIITGDATEFLRQYWFKTTDDWAKKELNECSPVVLERRDWDVDTSGAFVGLVRLRSHWIACGTGVTIRRPSVDVSITAHIKIEREISRNAGLPRLVYRLTPVLTQDPKQDVIDNNFARLFIPQLKKSTVALKESGVVADSCTRDPSSICLEPVRATFAKPKSLTTFPCSLPSDNSSDIGALVGRIPSPYVEQKVPALVINVEFSVSDEKDAVDANVIEDLFSALCQR